MEAQAEAQDKYAGMNGLEKAYAMVLESRLQAGDILAWAYERVTLKIGNDCRYTPDFCVVANDRIVEMHETKGFFRDDSKVKIKVAADLFPFRFFLVQRLPKKKGGGWQIQRIKSARG